MPPLNKKNHGRKKLSLKNVICARSVNPSEVTPGRNLPNGNEEGTGRGRDIEDEVKSGSWFYGKKPKTSWWRSGEKISKLPFRASLWVK